MVTLKQKLVGKTLKNISFDEYDFALNFDDGSVLRVFTAIITNLNSARGNSNHYNHVITEVIDDGECLRILMAESGSSIEISLDENLLVGPEFFIFGDVDGTTIVEN